MQQELYIFAMTTMYERTRMLVGAGAVDRIKKANVIVFGVGGVGGFCIEALVRAGIGQMTIVDFDKVDITNLNRQVIALHSTIGKNKTEVMADRAKDINPVIQMTAITDKVTMNNIADFSLEKFDYIVDAIDDTEAKLLLIREAKNLGIPMISSMGTGNKKDPSKFRIADIADTFTCPLAKKIRKELGRQNITGVKVLFSAETPEKAEDIQGVASISYNPAVAGLLIAAEVLKEIMNEEEQK